jgi:hypothetical protein
MGIPMTATLTVRHDVADYATWRVVYDQADTIRRQHGCTSHRVFRVPQRPNEVFATHDFPTVAQAEAFATDPLLSTAMQQGGVASAPRIEIYEVV